MRRTAVLAITTAFLVAGCGGGSDKVTQSSATNAGGKSDGLTTTVAPPVKTDVDVCALVPPGEVNNLLGGTMTATRLHDAVGSYGVCEWNPLGESAYRVRLTVGPANLYEVLKSKSSEPLAGLGDEAWVRKSAGTYGMTGMGARQGAYQVYVDMDISLDNGKELVTQVFEALD